jgi:hypothetical protein
MWTIRQILFGALLIAAGCATTPACNIDEPVGGKDCYECTRKAHLLSRDVDPYTKTKLSVRELTENCLRERGYVKEKGKD